MIRRSIHESREGGFIRYRLVVLSVQLDLTKIWHEWDRPTRESPACHYETVLDYQRARAATAEAHKSRTVWALGQTGIIQFYADTVRVNNRGRVKLPPILAYS